MICNSILLNSCTCILAVLSKNFFSQLSIDHRKQYVNFGSTMVVAMREDVPEGPFIQVSTTAIAKVCLEVDKLLKPAEQHCLCAIEKSHTSSKQKLVVVRLMLDDVKSTKE